MINMMGIVFKQLCTSTFSKQTNKQSNETWAVLESFSVGALCLLVLSKVPGEESAEQSEG